MPQPSNKILRSPIEKSLKNNSSQNSFRYSKNVSDLQEKRIRAQLFPLNTKKVEKMSFLFDPSTKYTSFRENIHLEVVGKLLVRCSQTSLAKPDEIVDKTLHLNEKKMKIYMPNGIGKAIRNIRVSFNHATSVNCSTLSFQSFNTFELYNDIEISLLKESDEFKLSNLLQNDIISQFELGRVSELIAGESEESYININTPRGFRTTLPCYPVSKHTFKHYINIGFVCFI